MHADLMSSNLLDLPNWTKIFCIKSCFLDCTWKGGSSMEMIHFFFLIVTSGFIYTKKPEKKNDCYYIVDGH